MATCGQLKRKILHAMLQRVWAFSVWAKGNKSSNISHPGLNNIIINKNYLNLADLLLNGLNSALEPTSFCFIIIKRICQNLADLLLAGLGGALREPVTFSLCCIFGLRNDRREYGLFALALVLFFVQATPAKGLII